MPEFPNGAGGSDGELVLDAEVVAILRAHFERSDPPVPIDLLARGRSAIAAAVAAANAANPEAADHPAEGVVPLSGRRSARHNPGFPARLAAAAAGQSGAEVLIVDSEPDGVHARWERSADGSLTIQLSADPPFHGLLQVSWHVEGGAVQRLVTPLASGPDRASVRYELTEPGAEERAIEFEGPEAIDPIAVDGESIRRAFSGSPRGIVIRAWREYLVAGSPSVAVAALVRTLLEPFDDESRPIA